MILLIGPCMFLAPLVVLLIPLFVVLWPPVLLLTGLTWLLVWPFAAVGQWSRARAAQATLGRWFRMLLTPWTYFDVPPTNKPPAGSVNSPVVGDDSPPPSNT